MAGRQETFGALILLALAASGCTSTSPTDYARSMAPQDPKWMSAECQQMRADAAAYQSRERPASMALLALGPYGMGILVAAKEHQEKKRQEFVRDMHLACSSRPLPANLQNLPGRNASSEQSNAT